MCIRDSRYADVEAVTQAPSRGHRAVLTEVWERYAAPLAITEVHIDAGREDQLRWAHPVSYTHLDVYKRQEHQQRDPDLRQLAGGVDVADKARGGGTQEDPRQQVADDCRELQPLSQKPKNERQ